MKTQRINDVLLDSGADITQIPKTVAHSLKLEQTGSVEALDYQGRSAGTKSIYSVRISFGNYSFLESAMETSGEPLLGRNILNRLTAVLRGVDNTLEVS